MIAREGHKILFGMAFVVFISGLLMIVFPTFLWNSIFIVTTTFLLFTLYFFRDPRRVRPERDNLVISAADGKIVRIQKINDDIVGESATLISIFLSVFNVHVNRMPVTGKFESVNFQKGKFLAAFDHRASDENECTDIIINKSGIKLRVKQIAGILARRIHCYAEEGQDMKCGDRLGFIRFGSRTDLILPESIAIKVHLNQKVIGGETIIGEFK